MSDTLRVLIVDDEPLARGMLREMLATRPEVTIAGECGDGLSAVVAYAHGTHLDLAALHVGDVDDRVRQVVGERSAPRSGREGRDLQVGFTGARL